MTLAEFRDEWAAALDWEERYGLLIALGRSLAPMDPALKTPATKVPGCSADVWVYPLAEGGRLRFQADSSAAITKGIVALILLLVDGLTPAEVLSSNIEAEIEELGLRRHLSSNRTQGIPNMIARVREAAKRWQEA